MTQHHIAEDFNSQVIHNGAHGGAIDEALCYKPEGHEFDSRWCHWNFSLK
jgi:hypothetical protein